MTDLTQAQVEELVLRALFDGANRGDGYVDANFIAAAMLQDVSAQRIQMALGTLDRSGFAKGRHSTISGSTYQISEEGYKNVEDVLAAGRNDVVDEDDATAPAADRIVGFDHNSRSYKEAHLKIYELQDQLKAANDLGDLTPRAAQVAAMEVGTLGETMKADFFRPHELWVRAKMTLNWIGREAAGALVGAAALALLALLGHLLGFVA